MKTIDVDLDIFKSLTNLLETTEDSYSAVIRRLLQPRNVRSSIWSISATTPALNSQGLVTEVDASRSEAENVAPSEPVSVPTIIRNAMLRAEASRIDLPKGTELRARYKGQEYIAYVIDGRTLGLNENQYSSLSGAAMAITHGPVSGYAFWKIRDPNTQRWIRLSEFKKAQY